MTTSKNQDHGHHNKSAKSDHDAKGKNLSSMSKDQVKKTAAQGGKAGHSAAHASKASASASSHGKQGFASMPKAQVKEIAAKGGKAGHSDKSHK